MQHDFNTIVMQNVAQSIVKIEGKNGISMKSAWIQHEFGINSTPIRSQLLYKALCNSGKNEISMDSAWIQHQSDFNFSSKRNLS